MLPREPPEGCVAYPHPRVAHAEGRPAEDGPWRGCHGFPDGGVEALAVHKVVLPVQLDQRPQLLSDDGLVASVDQSDGVRARGPRQGDPMDRGGGARDHGDDGAREVAAEVELSTAHGAAQFLKVQVDLAAGAESQELADVQPLHP